MKSNLISKSETTQIMQDISSQWRQELPKIKNLKCYYLEDGSQVFTGDGITVLKIGDNYLPFLSEDAILEKFPYVTVDMGAVKFVCNGANVMRPGITKYSDFDKDQVICVKEESQQKFLAVGKSCVSSKEMDSLAKGEVVNNMHYISDKFWEVRKEIKD